MTIMFKTTNLFAIVLFIFTQNCSIISCSDGDRSPYYQRCVINCTKENCTVDGEFTARAKMHQETMCSLLQWSCKDECRYSCMWRTIEAFDERGFDVPKFHGKWPFARFVCVQEPASAFFSLLNLSTHVYMFTKIFNDKRFSLKRTPLLPFWYIFFVICVNAWIWSFVFHSRDTPFTEFMDYTCALSMVLSLLVAAIVRVLYSRKMVSGVLVVLVVLYFAEHVRYLRAGMLQGRIDYDYNMAVNLVAGFLGALVWIVWAVREARGGRSSAWRLYAFNALAGAALLLELADFAPRMHVDAHALWHLATAPLPALFYTFVIDDMLYLQNPPGPKTGYKLA